MKKENDKIMEIINASLGINAEEKKPPDMTPMTFSENYTTKILLIRHGESLGNASRVFLGHTDLDLSERGYDQARRTAEYLSNEKIDKIYSSSLIRAYNTALPHAELRGIGVEQRDGLREIFAGEWENKSVTYIIEKYGDKYPVAWRQHFGTFDALEEGESVPHLAERIFDEIYGIAEDNVGKTVLIGTHAAAIRSFWGKLTQTQPEELAERWPFPDNASVSVVYFDGERLIAGEYSHSAHLSDI